MVQGVVVGNDDRRFPAAVILGVASFGGDLHDLSWDDDPAAGLERVLASCGHRVELVRDPDADAMSTRLKAARSGELDVVHVLSHGVWDTLPDRLRVAAKGACGPSDFDRWVDVRSWLGDVVGVEDGRPLLVLLDVCSAGAAAHSWLGTGRRPVWLLGAAERGAKAYRARFTRALNAVLDRLAAGESFGADPSEEFISLELLSTEVWRELAALATAEAGLPQKLTTSSHPLLGERAPALFRNPDYDNDRDPVRRARRGLDKALSATLAGLDEVLGGAHFRSRALGGTPSQPLRRCCFAGRTEQLTALSGWLDRPADPGGALRVVTGSPGTGKSALLGVLVCLAHPELAGLSESIQRLPAPVKPDRARPATVAAVHARNRGAGELLTSIARQLRVDEPGINGLLAHLRNRSDQPVIMLDALDEANDPTGVHLSLVVPLATARDDRGRPMCRLLVGTRDQPRFATVLDLARNRPGACLDLDTAPPPQVRTDVAAYVAELLDLANDHGPWAGAGKPVARALAQGVAEAVTPAAGRVEVGPFLLAQLYTHHLTAQPPPQDAATAATVGRRAPRTITELFRLELARSDTPRWLRPMLVAWAHAHGSGMPLSLAKPIAFRLAAAHGPSPAGPEPEELAAAVERARFYLRTDVDIDGSTLFALFHQSLQEHLTAHPFAEPGAAP